MFIDYTNIRILGLINREEIVRIGNSKISQKGFEYCKWVITR
jgi:hypothetical protein